MTANECVTVIYCYIFHLSLFAFSFSFFLSTVLPFGVIVDDDL